MEKRTNVVREHQVTVLKQPPVYPGLRHAEGDLDVKKCMAVWGTYPKVSCSGRCLVLGLLVHLTVGPNSVQGERVRVRSVSGRHVNKSVPGERSNVHSEGRQPDENVLTPKKHKISGHEEALFVLGLHENLKPYMSAQLSSERNVNGKPGRKAPKESPSRRKKAFALHSSSETVREF